MTPIDVLAVASEIYPLIKTGGLADVVGALPAALRGEGVHVRTLVPGYPGVMAKARDKKVVHAFDSLFGGSARVLKAGADDLDLLILDAPHLFDRPGNPYTGADGRDRPDNALRFAALARCGAEIGLGRMAGFAPAVVHAHDWQGGLMHAYLRFAEGRRPGTLMTIHNLAFQGNFPADLLPSLGLPLAAYAIDGVEFHGAISYLKAGIQYADRITTVSPTYAAEIRTPEGGMGLDGVLRQRGTVLSGILNGIDTAVWNPAADPLLAASFRGTRLGPRATNKAAIQQEFGLHRDAQTPLFGVVSRLSWQKGLDMLHAVLPTLLGEGAQLAMLGSGDAAMEAAWRNAAAANPGRIACVFGYDERLAHRIQAGADALIVPSRFEPCGLTQLCALRYGAIPLVARVGGLSDTVIDASPMALAARAATGIQFAPATEEMLRVGLQRTLALYRRPEAWHQMQKNGMATDVSWRDPARHYAALMREIAVRP